MLYVHIFLNNNHPQFGDTRHTASHEIASMKRSVFVGGGLVVVAALLQRWVATTQREQPATPSGADPYAILGVERDADNQAVTKAYRALARRWHPDKHNGDKVAEAAFATIASAYEVLTSPEKREIYDRLGESGLERLRDGDPSVHKDWLPPDEILRRIHNDGDEGFVQSLVTSSFASLSALLVACDSLLAPAMRQLFGERVPSVVITATEDGSGTAMASGGRTSGSVTFKFALSGKSFDFTESDVSHSNCARAKFLGMKTTFYLQCGHVSGRELSVSVPAGAFTVAGMRGTNAPSPVFSLYMS